MRKNKAFVVCALILWLCTTANSWAQTGKYFVEFTDKKNSPYTTADPAAYLSPRAIERRVKQNITLTERDLPVNPAYVQALQQAGAQVWYTSKWMNAALIEADSAALRSIQGLTFVRIPADQQWMTVARNRTARKPSTQAIVSAPKKTAPNGRTSATDALDYGFSTPQVVMIGADQMHRSGFTGKGMYVAVFDSGFRNVNQIDAFAHLFTGKRIADTYDFVARETSVYEDDSHGTSVLSTMAAYAPGELIGTAYDATYFLYRTEDAYSETRIEEINWLLAAERADSAGVDVINASVGYNTFDDPRMNYRRADMNGNTALITRAADLAAAVGMLVVTSAGNEGNNVWRTITAPADADSVLAVGAVDRNGNWASFSSIGPSADGRVKPNVAVQGQGAVVVRGDGRVSASNGTSFSSPLMAGMAASFWQAYPELTNMEVIDVLQRSASQFEQPDSLLGFGIPNFTRAAQLLEPGPAPGNKIEVWPNPILESGRLLNIRLHPDYIREPVTIQFFDTRGSFILEKVIQSPAIRNQFLLDPNYFRTGMYVLRISSSRFDHVTKVIKL